MSTASFYVLTFIFYEESEFPGAGFVNAKSVQWIVFLPSHVFMLNLDGYKYSQVPFSLDNSFKTAAAMQGSTLKVWLVTRKKPVLTRLSLALSQERGSHDFFTTFDFLSSQSLTTSSLHLFFRTLSSLFLHVLALMVASHFHSKMCFKWDKVETWPSISQILRLTIRQTKHFV